VNAGRRMQATQLYRELTGLGLAEAKAIVDKLR
jgi:ribosomal protein L7/L12